MTKVAKNELGSEGVDATLDTLAREGARRMIVVALEAEVEAYIERFRGVRGEDGRAAVVRNGRGKARQVTLGAGTVTVEAPRVNDKREVDGKRQKFTSMILPPYLRRSQNVSELLPVLYLRGLSTGDFREALPALLGDNASGLSPSAITRMVSAWSEERQAWKKRSLADRDYVYVWADGVSRRSNTCSCPVSVCAGYQRSKAMPRLPPGQRRSRPQRSVDPRRATDLSATGPSIDLDGVARPQRQTFDKGAFEMP